MLMSKADPGPAHLKRAPRFEKNGVCFCKFQQRNTHQFNCSQHAMFTICTLFSTLTTRRYGICQGALKQSPDPKISTAPPF